MRIDIYPEKAQYLSNEPIKIIVELAMPTTDTCRGVLRISHIQ